VKFRAGQVAYAVLLSIGGLGVAASIVIGGLIWRPSGRAS
jgi:hypothetical protein